MDCNVFRKRINDLLEDNISYDLKDAMLEHMEQCEGCKSIYKQEKLMDETFKAGLSIEPHTFRSLRGDIMKSIDRNRYGKSPLKKLIYHFKKYRKSYTSIAAVITLVVFTTPYFIKNGITLGYSKKESLNSSLSSPKVESASLKDSSSDKVSTMMKSANPQAFDNSQSGAVVQSTSAEIYSPIFEKKSLEKDYKVSFNTPWQDSANRIYSATVEGKGSDAIEEGIGSIVVKETSTGNQWSFNLLDNERQYSPKAVKWIDDKNLLVIIGHGMGTVDLGGDLYLFNIDTASTIKADPQNTGRIDKKAQVTKIQSVKYSSSSMLEVSVEVLVYEDDFLNKNHRENRLIQSPYYELVKKIQANN